MRSTKELLKIVLREFENYYDNFGLCSLVKILHSDGLISLEEKLQLHDYIDNNRPKAFSSLGAFINRGSGYYWPKEDRKNRIKWLNKHIKKTSVRSYVSL